MEGLFAFTVVYDERPEDGATYLHNTYEGACKELEQTYEDLIEEIAEVGDEIIVNEIEEDRAYIKSASISDDISEVKLYVTRIYE